MARFHELTVTDVKKTIRDAVVVSLTPTSGDFDFTQGQYLTFRRKFGDQELRRSYSICSGKNDGVLKVGIKRVDGGAFSSWVNEDLVAGDTLEAMEPMGNFFTAIEPSADKNYLGFAAGSGITPILSILKTTLESEPDSDFTLVYANRGVHSIMFRDELEDLKNTFMQRLNIINILGSDAQDIDLFTGRLDAAKCDALFSQWIAVDNVDTAFICGPEAMMRTIAASLKDHGLSDGQIKFEFFASAQPGRLADRKVSVSPDAAQQRTALSVTIDGTTRNVKMSRNQTVLSAAVENSLDPPFACLAGVCSTCRCKLVEGEVDMAANHALEDGEVARGFILSCQSYPITDKVVVDYDH
jgi:ring-1,2-phenylacetyl-CoA epoxidase subunit PaaE